MPRSIYDLLTQSTSDLQQSLCRVQCNEWRIYIALCVLLYTQSAFQSWGGLSSTTTSVQHPPGWCDSSHSTTAPVRSPHISYRWRGERDRANQVMIHEIKGHDWAPASSDHSTPALWRASWSAASPPGLETAPLATAKLCKGLCELPTTLLEVSFPPSRTSTPGGV